jgi:hypothetical protein
MQKFVDRHVPIELWPPLLRDRYEKKPKAAHDLKIKEAANRGDPIVDNEQA